MKNLKKIVENLLNELDNIRETQSKIIDEQSINEFKNMINIEFNQGKKYQSKSKSEDKPIPKSKSMLINLKTTDDEKLVFASKGNKTLYKLQKQLHQSYRTILDSTIELNKELDKPIARILKIEEAKVKEKITVEEFALIHLYSKEAQKGLRGRVKDPLPYIQLGERAKIQYRKSEIDAWIDRNNTAFKSF